MSVQVVTTLHQDGYNLYGQQFVNTWATYFPSDWKITYYAEKHVPVFPNRINVVDFDVMCPEWLDFYNYIKIQTQDLQDKKQINRYKKALRWSFKMFTLLHALKNSTDDYVVWLDADVYARASPVNNWIETILGGKCIAGQLENIKGFTHIETGILPIHRVHRDTYKVINWIEKGYIHREILNEPKPWDGAWIGKLYNSNIVSMNILHMLVHHKNNIPVIAKAFSNQHLNWLVHNVGDKKFDNTYSGRSGRTINSELI